MSKDKNINNDCGCQKDSQECLHKHDGQRQDECKKHETKCDCNHDHDKEQCDCNHDHDKEQCDCAKDEQEPQIKIDELSIEQLKSLCSFQNQLNQALSKENEELIKKVDELRKMISKNDTYLDQLVSVKADFDSYKQRVRTDNTVAKEEGVLKTIERIFPFIDTLEKARVDAQDGKAYELIYRQFCKVLFEMGIEEIEVMNKPFDHNTSSALLERETDEQNKGKVVEVYQKGFRFGDRVLRYAQVVVGK